MLQNNYCKMAIIILPAVAIAFKLFSFFSLVSSVTDTISQSHPLHDGITLVSSGSTFELGFFNPGNSTNRYVGIWYKNIPVRKVVWVANRDNPIKDNSSRLIISQDGNLVLLSQNQTILWSTNATTKALSSVAQLLDSGNLVLKDGKDYNSGQNFIWQSFDYPTDTFLAGMKFGWDKRTRLNRRVTAWKNWDDPSSGDFTSYLETGNNPEPVLWKGSAEYFRAGPWNGNRATGVFALKDNPVYNYEYVNNDNEVYYMYTLKNSSLITIVVLNQSLYLRQRLVWVPETKTWNVYQSLPQDGCDAYNICGAYGNCVIDDSPICQCLDGFKPKSPLNWNAMDWSQGCVHSEPWSCKVKDKDGFRKFPSMKVPDTRNSWINASMTLGDCRAKCMDNCSCTAYANLDSTGLGSGCAIWFGDLLDLRVSKSGQDLYIRMASSDTGNTYGKHGHKKKVILAVTIAILLVLAMLLALSFIICRHKKYREITEKTLSTEKKDEVGQEDLELPFFDLSTIANATKNFSNDNKLGEGGFGPVYKGTLPHGQEVAIKRLSSNSGQGLKEFKNEVLLCSKLQHRNLVKIIGYCIEREEKMLLYEYMPNKSLDTFLFDAARSELFDWHTRFNIISSIARGLLYLHQDSRLRIIHRDLKASNILLDNDMNPKISDFGMAKMCGGDQIEGNTGRIVGTYGYMAPEYAIDGLFSIKSDVFSFGVLLMEIISGKKNKALIYHDYGNQNLIGLAWTLWKEGNPEKLIDSRLGNSCILPQVVHCIQIGLLCVQHHPDDRPNMTSVIVMLGSENALPRPKEPGFLIKKVSTEGEHSSDKQTCSSVNEITVSLIDAR